MIIGIYYFEFLINIYIVLTFINCYIMLKVFRLTLSVNSMFLYTRIHTYIYLLLFYRKKKILLNFSVIV